MYSVWCIALYIPHNVGIEQYLLEVCRIPRKYVQRVGVYEWGRRVVRVLAADAGLPRWCVGILNSLRLIVSRARLHPGAPPGSVGQVLLSGVDRPPETSQRDRWLTATASKRGGGLCTRE